MIYFFCYVFGRWTHKKWRAHCHTNIFVYQKVWERAHGDFSNDDDFVNSAAKLDATRMEDSATMAHSQRARELIDHAMGNGTNIGVAIMEKIVAMARLQPTTSLIDHATGGVNMLP